MKTSLFRLIVYLAAALITIAVINSCKTKEKLVHKVETTDKSIITKVDSSKVVSTASSVSTKQDSSKKTNDYLRETKSGSYTEIEFSMDSGKPSIKLPLDTSGVGFKTNVINSILAGAKNVKLKIWDFQNKREQGKEQEQKAIKETDIKQSNKDSSGVRASQERKNIQTSDKTVYKKKDSSLRWYEWLISGFGASVLLFTFYKMYKMRKEIF